MNKPSSSGLRCLIDTISAIYGSLLSMGDDKHIANAMLIHLAMSKVDSVTKSKWEEQLDYDKLPLWSDCEEVLNRRFQHIAADETSSKSKLTKPKTEFNSHSKPSKSTFNCSESTPKIKTCAHCNSKAHTLANCSIFTTLPVAQRFQFVKESNLCINCLNKGHTVSKCKSQKCKICQKSHHSILHRYVPNQTQSSTTKVAPSADLNGEFFQASANHVSRNSDEVILATAIVQVKSRSGELFYARALLDSGSQVNIITEDLAQKLNLKREAQNMNILCLGKPNSEIKHKVHASFKSRINEYNFIVDLLVMRTISNLQPDHTVSYKNWEIPSNIELADPYFYKPQRIDVLLGAEVFYELLCVGQFKKGTTHPTFQKTRLGWVISGKYTPSQIKSCHFVNAIENEEFIDSTVKKFWEIEDSPANFQTSKLSAEEQQCEDHFSKNVTRLPSGKIQVKLPFKFSTKSLGLSFETAKRRFLSLERRLSKDCILKDMYMNFMQEYLDLGHMSPIDMPHSGTPHYVIPHQCVLRPDSTSTKLRVVFDASSKSSSLKSLNDILMVGPTIQPELFATLLRFRLNKFALTADITKMYLQVLIDETDRNFQIILWRPNSTQNIQLIA